MERSIGPYRILGSLGQGGMGEVLLAADDRLGRHVAIKRLPRSLADDADRRERFTREARAIAAINHPAIVALHDIGEDDGRPYLVLEHVDGRPLSRLLREETLPTLRATKLGLQIADALRATHRIGVLHRDVKTDNVLVTADDRVKVLDFGLAKAVGPQSSLLSARLDVSEEGMVVGSVPYMSPEQLLGLELDFRSDVFSFGVVYYEMLLGRRPFSGGNVPATIGALLYAEPGESDAREVPDPAVAPILERCLAKERGARYADAEELFVRMEEVLLELSTSRRPAAAATRKASIAILPLANLRPDPESDYLGPALSSAITERLSTLRSLLVRPSIYTDRYRGVPVDPAAVSRELELTYLVTGNYRRQGERMHIAFELIRTDSSTLLVKRSLQLPFDEVADFPDAVGQEIVRALAVALSPEDVARMERKRPASPEAYDLYLRSIGMGADPRQSAAARDMIESSIAKDPGFAPAWVELSRRYNETLINRFGTQQDRLRAIDAARRAFELDPKLGIAAAQLGNLLVDAGRAEEGTEVLRAGVRASPQAANLHEFLAYGYRFAGFLPQAFEELHEADRADPLRTELGPTLNNLLLYVGRVRQFLDEVPVASTAIRAFYRGFAFVHLGEASAARKAFDEAVRMDPDNQFSLMAQALAHHVEGRDADGLPVVADIVARRERNEIWDGEVTYKLAQIATLLGDLALAKRLFDEAVRQGFFSFPYFARDPLLAALRASGGASAGLRVAHERHERYRARFFPDLPPTPPPEG